MLSCVQALMHIRWPPIALRSRCLKPDSVPPKSSALSNQRARLQVQAGLHICSSWNRCVRYM